MTFSPEVRHWLQLSGQLLGGLVIVILFLASFWYGCHFQIGPPASPEFTFHFNGLKIHVDNFRQARDCTRRVDEIYARFKAEQAAGTLTEAKSITYLVEIDAVCSSQSPAQAQPGGRP